MTKALYYSNMGVIASAIGVLLYVSYLILWPVDLPIITNLHTQQENVAVGDELYYSFDITKTCQVPISIARSIACDDGNLVTLTSLNNLILLGSHRVTQAITIPEKTSVGACKLLFVASYEVNTLRTEKVEAETNQFNVTH